ncbi:MAG: ATP-binding protein [Alphaproteobacteria bacterium]|jgi:predicted AAA+ superfamily ATPase|nr:ATP-binding protein [Alphaproteobacteria bacterium]
MVFYQRWQLENIKSALKTRRVVLLSGPRQCGKTTLAKQLVSPEVKYLTLDDITLREAATRDPQSFVQHKHVTLIIDEIQRVPSLLMAIKKNVDENTRPGQYLLTGSANIQSIPSVQESLAGRITKIRLKTLSQGEIQGARPNFLEHAFNQNFQYAYKAATPEDVLRIASAGGFPEAIQLQGRSRRKWHLDYVESLLERDLKEIAHIHKHDAMGRLVEILAAWSSKYIDIPSICSGLSLRRETLESYINALESLYLIERIPAWRKTDYDRVGKKPKFFMADCGLIFSLLSWNLEKIRFQSDPLGKLIETFAFNEVSTQIDIHSDMYELFQYRDREKREIDFIVEREDQSLLGLEIKSAAVVTKDDFKHLLWFKNNLAKNKEFVGIVLYTGDSPLSFGKDLWAVPIPMLWGATI